MCNHYPKCVRALFFKQGTDPKTRDKQWQARQKFGQKIVMYVPAEDSLLPSNKDEVWLCEEKEIVADRPDQNFQIVSVRLIQMIFDKGYEFTVRFVLDKTRSLNGKNPWNCRLKIPDFTAVLIPDKSGCLQPSEGREFWVCRFCRVASIEPDDSFILVAVELVCEDVEAQKMWLSNNRGMKRNVA